MGRPGRRLFFSWGRLALALLAPLLAGRATGHASQTIFDANLLINRSMEVFAPAYASYPPDGRPLQVAAGWHRFWREGGGWSEPYWMDARVFNPSWVEKIHGLTSQCLFSDQPFEAGLYQQVSGLTPGVGYGFNAPVTSVYRSSALPRSDGKIFKQVGLDPTGGTDPDAPTVVWSALDGTDRGWRLHLRAAAFAEGGTVTAFVRVISPEPAGPWPYLNQSWLDSALLAQTPHVRATSPLTTSTPTFSVSWAGAQPAPGGTIQKYDVQVLDEAEGAWHDWQTDTTSTSALFSGEMGHAYRFRARAWQAYDTGGWLFSPYRAEGDTSTRVGTAWISGHVRDIWDRPITGAVVAVSGTPYAATTQPGGGYGLYTPPLDGLQAVKPGHSLFGPVPPTLGVELRTGADVRLDFVLPPLSDAAVNGGFEDGLDGWQVADSAQLTATAHTGAGALLIASPSSGSQAPSPPPGPLTVVATTTFPIQGLIEPALSVWYAPQEVEAGGRVELWYTLQAGSAGATAPIAASRVFTLDLDLEDWHHAWWPLAEPGEVLTGTVMLRVAMEDASAVLDELVLGGVDRPLRLYLPLVR